MNDRNNAAEAATTADAWRQLVDKGLRGRPFSDLVTRAAEGFSIQPLALPAAPLPVHGRAALPWQRLQRLDHPDADRAGAHAVAALNAGASGLALVMGSAPSARGFGLTPDDLGHILRDVVIDACPIRIEAGADAPDVAAVFATVAAGRRIDPALVDVAFGIDPLAAMAATGMGRTGWPRRRAHIAACVSKLAAQGYRGPFLTGDGRRAHEAGADAASELAFVLASTVAYWRMLDEAGLDPDRIAGAVDTVLAADSDQFLTIAKFRAVRLLIRRLRRASAFPEAPIRVHGETSFRMTTRLDAHSNLIRAAIAAFAAGVGGVDSMAVLPFTAPFGLAGDTARRLALDTQSVLIEEANLFRVADPSAGSGSIEAMTLDLAEAAWRRFQTIEREGGLAASLAAGLVQQRIGAERANWQAAVAEGSVAIVGTTLFRATLPSPIDIEAPCPAPVTTAATEFEPLPSVRTSETAEGEAA
ncbi:methylmalonyl-CoA mutase [Kaistia algarum]|uniref:methylmalonyl-CoA mutase family protein n=1 Tax=Kaistia algarum TaxID=2083279 RepID=UPI000CE83B12|nr:methylmalonyl-CoA mutase family protein [Kaistia algarum]MCX5512193.1 methylmalonyl-CoA mutase family protein [Kaistia algarum]PPE80290.1 methylmalonyl-CoA mutase [Kaistia algarum]